MLEGEIEMRAVLAVHLTILVADCKDGLGRISMKEKKLFYMLILSNVAGIDKLSSIPKLRFTFIYLCLFGP